MKTRIAKILELEGGKRSLLSPSVGAVLSLPEVGSLVVPGQRLGVIETLGVVEDLLVPEGVAGRVVTRSVPNSTRAYVGYGDALLVIDPQAMAGELRASERADAAAELVFRAPMSGRFYVRPAPTKSPLVESGAILARGDALGLLEVMKTFHRVVYGGEGLPERARVLRVVPADGEDVLRGVPLLELEPA